jgi:hypothetical protein
MENKNYMLLDWAGDVAVPDNDTMTYLASRGNVKLMQNCVNSYYVRWDIAKACAEAARNGQLYVLEWMLENGIELHIPNILHVASDNIVKWINGMDLPFGTQWYRLN